MPNRTLALSRCTLIAATALGLVPLSSAGATAVQTQTFSDTYNVTDTPAGGATSGSHNYGSLTFNKFDTATGVLKGVSVELTSTRTETTTLKGTAPSGTSAKRNNASNTTSATLTAPAIFALNPAQPVALSHASSCGKNGVNPPSGCPVALTSNTLATNATFNVGPVGRLLYVGPGTVGVSLDATLSALNTTTGGTWTNPSNSYKVDWSGSVSVKYSYNQHSEASFNSASTNYDTLKIDFGKVDKNTHPAEKLFSIFNMMQTDDLADGRETMYFAPLSSSSSGDTGKFDFVLPPGFLGPYAAGDGKSFGIDFDTSTLGAFGATYYLTFADDPLDGGIGHASNSMVLYVTGEVVPEPVSLAILGGGLMVMGAFRKRRKA